MKKIYALLEIINCIFIILFFTALSIFLFLNAHKNIFINISAFTCIVVVFATLIKLFYHPTCFTIHNGMLQIFIFPFFATNKYYDKKRSLIEYNNQIIIDEVESIELIKLTKEEMKKYIGYKYLLKKCLKFNMKYGNPKYIYVGNYSNFQIKKIISLVTNR